MIKFLLVIAALCGAFFGTYKLGERAEHAKMQLVVDRLDADLDQCHANGRALNAAIAGQNEAIRKNSAADAAKLATASTELTKAQQETREAQAVFSQLMRPLVGVDTCARVLEVDRRFLETLK